MSPLKKRQRLLAEQQQQQQKGIKPTVESIQSVFADLVEKLQQHQQSDSLPLNQMEFLRQPFCQIAEWQRQLYDTIAQQEAKLGALTADRIKSQRKEQAEAYERSHLQSQIDQRQKFATPNLIQLAREETGSTSLEKNDDSIDKEVKQKFLEADTDNPTHRDFIVAKLEECLEQRAALEKVAESKRQALQKLTKQIQEKKEFLKSLPQHVKTIQRATAGLAKYVAQQPSSLQHMTGSTRLQRLEMAQKLPTPLYTIYALLQQYVDETVTAEQQQNLGTNDTEADINATSPSARIRLLVNVSSGIAAAASSTISSSYNDEVVLQLPVEDFVSPTNTSKKRVSIHFRFQDQPRPVVTTYATGCASTLNQDILLEELFAGDRAMVLEWTPASTAATTGPLLPPPPPQHQAKSYQWCNYLAGLYHTTPEAEAISSSNNNTEPCAMTESSPFPTVQQQQQQQQRRLSTRLIMHELQKRVRANAAWKHIWSSLQRYHVPLPSAAVLNKAAAAATDGSSDTTDYLIPSHDPMWKPSCKLAEFVEASTNKTSTATSLTTFQVTLRRNSDALSCSVTVDTVRYPAVPPVWNLLSSSPSASTQFYDNRLAQLQQQVNHDALTRAIPDERVSGSMTEANDNNDSVGNSNIVRMTKVSGKGNEQQYYEWILVHQLREIMHQWELDNSDESAATVASSTRITVGSERTRKGRDRKLLK